MYLHHELREVAPNRQSEALTRISELHHLMQGSPGFVRSLACRYLGSLTQYAWLRTWTSSEAHLAFRQTEAAKRFAQTRPEGLYWPLPGGIASDGHWRSVLEAGRVDAGGDYLLRTAFAVPKDAVPAFVEARSAQDDAVIRSAGVVSVATFESETESDERTFLSMLRTTDLAAYRAFLETEQAGRLMAHEAEISRTLVTECYEVVEELRGIDARG